MITEQLLRILEDNKRQLKGVTPPTLGMWKSGRRSPLLKNVDQICEANNLKVLVYDGNLDTLIKFAHDIAKEQGLKMILNFEV